MMYTERYTVHAVLFVQYEGLLVFQDNTLDSTIAGSFSQIWPFPALNTINHFSSVVVFCIHFTMHTFYAIFISSLEKNLHQAENDICISLNGVVTPCKSTALDLQDLCQSPSFIGSEAQHVLNHMKTEHWEHEHVLRSRHRTWYNYSQIFHGTVKPLSQLQFFFQPICLTGYMYQAIDTDCLIFWPHLGLRSIGL